MRKKIQKVLGLFITSTMLLSLFNVNTVFAANDKDIDTNSSYSVNDDADTPINVKENSDFIWRGAIFGQSTNNTFNGDTETELTGGNSEIIAENYGTANGNITVKSWKGAGKIKPTHDGIAYYYTTVPNDKNFTLTADIYVRGYLGYDLGPYNVDQRRDGQESFGIMARDVIPLKSEKDNSITTNPNEAKVDEYGAVPLNTDNAFSSNMVAVGGYSGKAYPTDPMSSSYYKNSHINRINLISRSEVTEWDGVSGKISDPIAVSSAFPKAGIAGESKYLTGAVSDQTQTGDKYRITLKKINLRKTEAGIIRGFQATCTNLETGETWTAFMENDEMNTLLEVQDKENAYVGFYAARWAIIDVSNVNIYTSDVETDPILEPSEDEPLTPDIICSSSLYTKNTNYKLALNTNNKNGGYVTVSLNNEVVYSDIKVSEDVTYLPITLKDKTKNIISVLYTPSELDNLDSYDTVAKTFEIECNSYAPDTDIYPLGDVDANGVVEEKDVQLLLDYVRGVNMDTLIIADNVSNYMNYIDLDSDGILTATDVVMIKNIIKS